MKSLWAKILAWLKETFEAVPVPSPDGGAITNPTPQEPPSSFDLFKVKWLGDNFSDAVEDMELVAARRWNVGVPEGWCVQQ